MNGATRFREVIRPMRLAGATLEEIGARLGVTRSAVHEMWRRQATDEDNAALAVVLEQRAMTQESIIAAIREWYSIFGEPPSAAAWNGTLRRRNPRALARYESTGRTWPSTGYTSKLFGSWRAALSAAGYEPRPVGAAGHERFRNTGSEVAA